MTSTMIEESHEENYPKAVVSIVRTLVNKPYRNFIITAEEEPPVPEHLLERLRTAKLYRHNTTFYLHIKCISSYRTTFIQSFFPTSMDISGILLNELGQLDAYDYVKTYRKGNKISEALLNIILKNNETFVAKIELGKDISRILETHDVYESSLLPAHRAALLIYQTWAADSQAHAVLRPWQKTLINEMKTPTAREILWIIGREGNEGKTWFQEYVRSIYKPKRVWLGGLSTTPANIYHELSQHGMTSMDIFLFDLPRGDDRDISYQPLEKIKNGRCISEKYHSRQLKFHTPNIIAVFANYHPRKVTLSIDRWKVFKITDATETGALQRCPCTCCTSQ